MFAFSEISFVGVSMILLIFYCLVNSKINCVTTTKQASKHNMANMRNTTKTIKGNFANNLT